MAGAAGTYLLLGDVVRAARYAAPAPAAVTDPVGATRLPATVPLQPDRIDIPEAGVSTIVEPASATDELNAFTGEVVPTFPVPGGPFTTVWWEEGPQPGAPDGVAVILGHTRPTGRAVFNDLPGLEPGAVVGVSGHSSGGEPVVARYLVTDVVTDIPKSDDSALRAVLDSPPTGASLALITCSGEVDRSRSARSDNTVVFATLEGVYRR